jgi:hypothetical protein
MEQIEDEIEENGEASKKAMDRLQMFCQTMNVKVDRIGPYLYVMGTRAEHCKQEAARLRSTRQASAEQDRSHQGHGSFYLESHDLKQLETEDTTLRRQKNSQDSVLVTNPDVIPPISSDTS